MLEEERELISQIKNLFDNNQLLECIQEIEKHELNRSIYGEQTLALYKGMCLNETDQIKEGYACFESIIKKSNDVKSGKVDEIDVLLRIYYQIGIYYYDASRAEDLNVFLFQIIEEYRRQNEGAESYQKGVYLFGKGIYTFIENNRNQFDNQYSKYLEEALELAEDLKQNILLILGWIYYTNGLIENSSRCYNQLQELNPNYPGLWVNQALICEENMENEKAEQLLLKAEESCKFNLTTLENLAYLYKLIGDNQKQDEYMTKLITLNPNNERACHKFGAYLIEKGQTKEGLEYLKQSIEINPNYKGAYEELVELEKKGSKYQMSLEYLFKLISISPNDGYYYYKVGTIYSLKNQPNEAIQYFRNATKVKNEDYLKILSHSSCGKCLLNRNRILEALIEYFNACNYYSEDYEFDLEFRKISDIIIFDNPELKFKQKLEIINSQSGNAISKFEEMADYFEDENMKGLFLYKLDIYREILTQITYTKLVKSMLTYQSEHSHFDLFLD